MTPPAFGIHPTSRYKRLSTKLQKGHRDFEATEKSAAAILSEDPYNRTRRHHIKKLEGCNRRRRTGFPRPLAFPLRHPRPGGSTFLLRPPQGRHILNGWRCGNLAEVFAEAEDQTPIAKPSGSMPVSFVRKRL